MSHSSTAICVEHLWHHFGTEPVLKDVSFRVARGEIFGFIGPNGAGKTTTIRILATLLEPSAGIVEVDGSNVLIDPEHVRRVIGYMPDHTGLYERLTVREYLDFFAQAFGLDTTATEKALTTVGISSFADRPTTDLSKGMRQRLQLARILVHDPQILILDEPASALDPRARIELRELLLKLRDIGKTIFLSSHILTELSDLCTSVGILEHGQLIVSGPIGEISEQLGLRNANPLNKSAIGEPSAHQSGTEPKRVRVWLLGNAQHAADLLQGGTGVLGLEALSGGQLLVQYAGDDQFVADMVHHLASNGLGVVGVERERNDLERIFMQVTGGNTV